MERTREQWQDDVNSIQQKVEKLKKLDNQSEKNRQLEVVKQEISTLKQRIVSSNLEDVEKKTFLNSLASFSSELTDLKSEIIGNIADENQNEEQKSEEKKKNFFGKSWDWIKGHPWWSAGIAAVTGWGIWKIFKKSKKDDEVEDDEKEEKKSKTKSDSKKGKKVEVVDDDGDEAEKDNEKDDKKEKREEKGWFGKLWDKTIDKIF